MEGPVPRGESLVCAVDGPVPRGESRVSTVDGPVPDVESRASAVETPVPREERHERRPYAPTSPPIARVMRVSVVERAGDGRVPGRMSSVRATGAPASGR